MRCSYAIMITSSQAVANSASEHALYDLALVINEN
jgi:hypothetical protein